MAALSVTETPTSVVQPLFPVESAYFADIATAYAFTDNAYLAGGAAYALDDMQAQLMALTAALRDVKQLIAEA
jgi:hypothetical protein